MNVVLKKVRTSLIQAGQIFVINDLTWGGYRRIGDTIRDRPAFRLTYDDGTLEIMTTSYEHEDVKYLLGRIIDTIVEEARMPIKPGGSMTFQREDLEKGLEPDQCYYSQNASAIAGKKSIDLAIDPPPDLCIEVDVANRSIDRLSIYAKMKMPEVWRWELGKIIVYSLQKSGLYKKGTTSNRFIKGLNVAEVATFVRKGIRKDQVVMVRSFRRYFRSWLAGKKR